MNTTTPSPVSSQTPQHAAEVSRSPGLRRRAFNRQRFLVGILLLLVAMLIPGQFNWWRLTQRAKSAEILEFEGAFQIRFEGETKHPTQTQLLFDLAAALQKLAASRYPATNLTVRLVPASFWQRSLVDQVNALLNRAATYEAGRITLYPGVRSDGFQVRELVHELKHFQHEQLRVAHPEFDQAWAALNRPHGYRTLGDRLRSLLQRGTGPIQEDPTGLEHHSSVDPIWWARGYVTQYAATSLEEDIAELCSLAEDRDADKMFYLILADCPAKETYRRKLALAQQYGLVPAGYLEFIPGYFAAVEQIGRLDSVETLPQITTNGSTLAVWAAYATFVSHSAKWSAVKIRAHLAAALQLPHAEPQAVVQLGAVYQARVVAPRAQGESARKALQDFPRRFGDRDWRLFTPTAPQIYAATLNTTQAEPEPSAEGGLLIR